MSFLSPTDFDVIPYNLANNDNSSFPDFIQKTEDTALKNLLGLSFYTELKNQVKLLPAEWVADNAPGYAINDKVVFGVSIWKSLVINNLDIEPVEGASWTLVEESVWLKFIKGDYYTYNEKQYYWEGLVDMLQPLVYSMWLKYTQFSHSKHGMVKPTVENAEVINPAYFIAKGYNDFAAKAGNCFNPLNTLWGYLYQTNLADASVWDSTFDPTFYSSFLDYFQHNFKNPKRMNAFNI